ncbi:MULTISPECIES: hypothetical protein [Amycolatopsis]|uniref:Uncharacterized protein n=1 Tax=Amycolatopsis thermalba TaxID=944492 RepID=A0ABY4NMH4_9PSEU|nr:MULTISPECIES: hypothetical protein [Amycolatopsis]OXM74683.1 hypothetical protein CF166_03935 [Amycolatopsis sp. KNN50.9b]UQS21693.1 hypothetical protein L1857_02070 [Amycolatopsis thermalba]
MVVNVAIYLVVCATPPVLFWLASKTPAVVAALRRRTEPAPAGPPIEQLAADLRRVHRCLADLAPDAPMLRRRATHQAYDALLVQACAALGLRHWLDELPEGVERDVERLRVEEALRRAGLAVP